MAKGPLIVLSGPSGSGKSTVIDRLLERTRLPLRLAVSATTRPPRPGEVNGIDYHFLDAQRFEELVKAGAFLEHADVFGNCYGTLQSEVDPYRGQGLGVLLEIDVQGAESIRQRCPDAVSVFLRASSIEEYEKRLRARGTEDEASLQRRLAGARCELAQESRYHYSVINDDIDQAVRDLESIIQRQFEGSQDA